MKFTILSILSIVILASCNEKRTEATPAVKESSSLTGTWQLVSSQVITGGDTVRTFPVKDQEMIKIFTGNQFAFFKHDINKGQGENAIFESGSGSYTISGETYSEHLTYCSARGWEDKDFTFNLQMRNDSLIQKGIEKIDSLNINQEIVEVYHKLR